MAYGLQVINQNNSPIITPETRLVRYHSTGTVVVSKGSYVDVTVTGMTNTDSWSVMLSYASDLWFTVEARAVKSTNKVRIHNDEVVTPLLPNPSALSITYIIVRT